MEKTAKNVLGGDLVPCSYDPLTGFLRDGCCHTGPEDAGDHVVCARMTEAFFGFSSSKGNDLVTPKPEWRFAGLKPGDRWCLCVHRWIEALQAGAAPPVVLQSTHENALQHVSLNTLKQHAWAPGERSSPPH
ncbi:DUF2237 family protein [Hydrogenophaga sp.]|uniref:DUF2237 family protein n=1 Tax=Hydrogenophaga sp. TaxID=1904254 RepID=UPI0035624664